MAKVRNYPESLSEILDESAKCCAFYAVPSNLLTYSRKLVG